MLHRILIAVDGSHASRLATLQAIELAKLSHATIRAIYVADDSDTALGSAAIDQAAAGSRAATLGKDMARQNLTLATVGAYAEVLTARDLVASYGKLVDALGEIVRHTGLRYDVGDATSSEVAQAKARRAEGQAGLVQAQGRLTAALARLERLTGKRPTLREEGKSRSILSLRDETPGTIALFSPLIDARVLLDGAFVGYTTGDRRVPLLLDGLEPGVHEVSTDLGRDFGVVKLPEVSFGPWKELVRVPAGKKVVIVDASTHFNEVLYRLKQLVSESKTAVFDSAGLFSVAYPFSFVDRTGASHAGRIALDIAAPVQPDAHGRGTVYVELDGSGQTLALDYTENATAEARATIGLASFRAEVDQSYGRVSVELAVERTDVDQGMHRLGD